MARKNTKQQQQTEALDGVFVLKMLFYLILGMQWVWFTNDMDQVALVLPVGPALGVLFARHEHFQIDRRIEYTILLLSGAVSFLLGVGIYF